MQPRDNGSGMMPPASEIELREITRDTVRAICRLKVAPEQAHFVADNATSIAEAHFEPDHAWFRAIYAGETPVGFVMLYEDPGVDYFLWRYMIDQRYQGLGYGRRALELVIDHVRAQPHTGTLGTSYVPGAGSPGEFYHKLGFVDTGEVDDDELVSRLALDGGVSAGAGGGAAAAG